MIGMGNIAGVAFAIFMGGPAALFWMLVTGFVGMCTKFVEVTLSHKYRDFDEQGMVAGGPMYYMKKRLNINLKSGKVIKTGKWLGIFFAAATILSSFGIQLVSRPVADAAINYESWPPDFKTLQAASPIDSTDYAVIGSTIQTGTRGRRKRSLTKNSTNTRE